MISHHDPLIVPLGILLVVRLIPAGVLAEHRTTAVARQAGHPVSDTAAFMFGLWVVAAMVLYWWLEPHMGGSKSI